MACCTLRYRPTATADEVVRHVASAAELRLIMESVAARHHEAELDWVPGISLWCAGRDTPAGSLNIAMGGNSWAVVHTDDEFWQSVTCGGSDQGARCVLFDDFIDIPGASFIDKHTVLGLIDHWLTTGGLPDDVAFSDDLFGEDPAPSR